MEKREDSELKAINEEIEKELEASGVMPPEQVVAMTIWGEARGESFAGKRAVAGVIHNRAIRRSARTDIPYILATSDVCLAPYQFSCWDHGDFVQQEPILTSSSWNECLAAANEIFAESYVAPTKATHYYAVWLNPPPKWAKKLQFVETVGDHLFFLEDGWR